MRQELLKFYIQRKQSLDYLCVLAIREILRNHSQTQPSVQNLYRLLDLLQAIPCPNEHDSIRERIAQCIIRAILVNEIKDSNYDFSRFIAHTNFIMQRFELFKPKQLVFSFVRMVAERSR